jgi:hypothetical protein
MLEKKMKVMHKVAESQEKPKPKLTEEEKLKKE